MPAVTDRDAVAAWGLQFTPRVALAEADAVLMEVAASLRLFGGRDRLVRRVEDGARELGIDRIGWAPTGLAALAFARCGVASEPGLNEGETHDWSGLGSRKARLEPHCRRALAHWSRRVATTGHPCVCRGLSNPQYEPTAPALAW